MILTKGRSGSPRFCPRGKVDSDIKPCRYRILNFQIDKKDFISPRGRVEGTSK